MWGNVRRKRVWKGCGGLNGNLSRRQKGHHRASGPTRLRTSGCVASPPFCRLILNSAPVAKEPTKHFRHSASPVLPTRRAHARAHSLILDYGQSSPICLCLANTIYQENSLRLVPAKQPATASIADTANSFGVHDTLIYGPRSLADEIKTTNPLQARLENVCLPAIWICRLPPPLNATVIVG